MAESEYTPIPTIIDIHRALTSTFDASTSPPSPSGTTTKYPKSNSPYPLFSLPYRQHQLLQIAKLVQENADAFCEAIFKDFGKPRQEILMTEVGSVIQRALMTAQQVKEWTNGGYEGEEVALKEPWMSGWKARVEWRPKGAALIISPWNYPLILTFQPLLGAVAAGCPAAIKPSEIVPAFSSLLAKLIPKYLDPASYQVILGGVKEISKALELKWGHIFYTGNGRVARIISAAAAKHLTPLTLELGGKSPVIVDPSTIEGPDGLEIAAKRIIWGKINNAGQICVAPDYVLMPAEYIPAFTDAITKALATFFPDGAANTPDYGRIVSEPHFARVKNLLEKTKGKVVIGGKTGKGGEVANDRLVEPTVVVLGADQKDDILLEDELFAPILPILTVASVREAVEYVRARDHPLVIYAFTDGKKTQDLIRNGTLSGTIVFNDTFQQVAINEIPFGGVGESGYGSQVLKYTFELFSYRRSVVEIPPSLEPTLGGRYPPSSKESLAFFEGVLKEKVPSVEELGDSAHANGNGHPKENGTL